MDKPQAPWWAQYMIASLIILSFDGTLVGVFWIGDPNMLIVMVSAIVNISMLVIGYFYGSSDGSKNHSQTIATALGKKEEPTAQPVAIAVNNPVPEGVKP